MFIDGWGYGGNMAALDPFNARRTLSVGGDYFSLDALDANGVATDHLPYSIRILLEGALRGHDGFSSPKTTFEGLPRGRPTVSEVRFPSVPHV